MKKFKLNRSKTSKVVDFCNPLALEAEIAGLQ